MISRRAALLAACSALPAAARAASAGVVLRGEPAQGALLVGQAPAGTRLALDGHPVRVGPDGVFVLGFGRDAKPDSALEAAYAGGRAETRRIAVARREWQVQRLEGLPGAMVTPPPEVQDRIARERAAMAALRKVDSPEALFADGFSWPAQGRISGVYGSQRVLNGEARAPHLGLDIAAPAGTPVLAMAPGRVLLAAEFYFLGNVVLLDHGHGVQSLYAHLSRVDVAEGMALARRQTLGAIGATGRVTGAHLHLGLNWFATAVDPRPLLPPVQR
ncbi:MAG: M23 family metallopeptidase [Acetobacteraceae bacterium]|nr:M23 family metallopeptidase [Acetobacteraceae bacterium]